MFRSFRFSLTMFGLLAAAWAPAPASAQKTWTDSGNPENFHIEIMGSGWMLDSTGHIQANGTPVDFITDLNIAQQQPTFFGRFVYKPGRKQRIEVEGTPFDIHGSNTIDRVIVYRGETFNLNQSVKSSASLNYLYAGYQYYLLSGRMGHLGLAVGGAYLSATGTLSAQEAGLLGSVTTTASKSQSLGLPLAGIDFRIFPIPGHRIVELEGGMRGMDFGSYGYYVQGIAQGGICLGKFAVLGGYRAVDTSLYESSGANPSGITARLKGPIFSGLFRW